MYRPTSSQLVAGKTLAALIVVICIAASGCGSPLEPHGQEIVIEGRVVSTDGTPIPGAAVAVWLRHPCALCIDSFSARTTAGPDGRFSATYVRRTDPDEGTCFDSLMRVGVRATAPGFLEGEVEENLCSIQGGPANPTLILELARIEPAPHRTEATEGAGDGMVGGT